MSERTCWVNGCEGDHDKYRHPAHNCPLPTPINVPVGTFLAQCPECHKIWTPTARGWKLVE